MRDAGWEVLSCDLSRGVRMESLTERVRAFGAECVIGLHAWRSGPTALSVAQQLGLPLAIAIGGTDIEPGLREPEHLETMRRVFERAALVLLQADYQRVRLVDALGIEIGERLRVVRPSVVAPAVQAGPPPAWLSELGLEKGERLVVLVAGIRAVKGVHEALTLVEAAQRVDTATQGEGARIRFVIAGPVLDAAYARPVLRWIDERSWAAHIEDIPFAEMPWLYRRADVVINTSHSEGISNAVLEAMACGSCVLARGIAANRDALRDHETGRLFQDDEQGARVLATLLSDDEQRKRLGLAAQQCVASERAPRIERDALLASLAGIAPPASV